MHEAHLSDTAQAILDYLRRNPEAQDTVDGISQWWLPREQLAPRTAAIRKALQELIEAKLISEHHGKDAQISYRITTLGLQQSEKNSNDLKSP